jgi:RNA recognition motif-containing protein
LRHNDDFKVGAASKMATDRQKRRGAAAARQKAARSQKIAKKRNILDRLGAEAKTKVVTVRGVGPTVSAVEVRDLFASVGAVDRVTSSLGANTSSTTYEVAFRTPSKARAAVAEFDGRALDGRPLRVALKGGAPAAAAARVVVDVAAKAARTARPPSRSRPVVVDVGGPRRPKKQRGKTAVRKPPKSKKSPRRQSPRRPESMSRVDRGAAGRLISAALR